MEAQEVHPTRTLQARPGTSIALTAIPALTDTWGGVHIIVKTHQFARQRGWENRWAHRHGSVSSPSSGPQRHIQHCSGRAGSASSACRCSCCCFSAASRPAASACWFGPAPPARCCPGPASAVPSGAVATGCFGPGPPACQCSRSGPALAVPAAAPAAASCLDPVAAGCRFGLMALGCCSVPAGPAPAPPAEGQHAGRRSASVRARCAAAPSCCTSTRPHAPISRTTLSLPSPWLVKGRAA